MNINEVHSKIDADLNEFHKNKSLNALQAAVALAQSLRPEPGVVAEERTKLRQARMVEMLTILDAIDQEIDPTFDPSDVPSSSVAPPVVGGVVLDSGIDPKHVKDPQTRAAYQKAIEQNSQKAQRYAFQNGLRREDNELTREVEKLMHEPYAATEQGRHAIKEVIARLIKNAQRKANLEHALNQNH